MTRGSRIGVFYHLGGLIYTIELHGVDASGRVVCAVYFASILSGFLGFLFSSACRGGARSLKYCLLYGYLSGAFYYSGGGAPFAVLFSWDRCFFLLVYQFGGQGVVWRVLLGVAVEGDVFRRCSLLLLRGVSTASLVVVGTIKSVS